MYDLAAPLGVLLGHPDHGAVAAHSLREMNVVVKVSVAGVDLMDKPHAILVMADGVPNLESLRLTHGTPFQDG